MAHSHFFRPADGFHRAGRHLGQCTVPAATLTAQQAAKGIAPDGWRQEAPGQWHFTFTAGEDLSSLTLCVTNTAAPLEAERLTDLARSGELYALDVTPGETVELVFACRRSPQTWLMTSAFASRAFRFRTMTQLIALTAFVTMGMVLLALYHYKHLPELRYFLLYLVIMSAWALMVFFFPAGLVLYWLTNNVLSIAQQWYVNKQIAKERAKRLNAVNQ